MLIRVEDPPVRAVQTIAGITASFPSMPVVAYSSRDDSDLLRRVMIAGNMVGPTSQGIGDRLSRTGYCSDSFSDVFSLGPDGVYSIRCPSSPRIILVPVVDGLPNPGNATIVDFALLYLESYRFNGGHSEVTGKLVRVNITDPEEFLGGYRNNGLRVLRLVQ